MASNKLAKTPEAQPAKKAGVAEQPNPCGGHNRDGTRCRRAAGHGTDHPGQGRCAKHGGNSGTPLTHARYSKYAPERIRDRIIELHQDETLMDLTAEVALVTAMIEQELDQVRVEVGEAAENWQLARTLYDTALSNAGTPEGLKALNQLGSLLRGENHILTRWKRIDEMLGRKAELVRIHARQMRDASQTLSPHEVVLFVMRVSSVITEELVGIVPPEVLDRIGKRVEAFLN